MKVDSKVNNSAAQIQGLNTSKANEAKKGKESALAGLGENPAAGNAKALKQEAARIQLSEKVQDMKKAKELASQTPDVDAEKVKKFQALIDSGNYKVDSKKIADKLVDDHLMTAAMTEVK